MSQNDTVISVLLVYINDPSVENFMSKTAPECPARTPKFSHSPYTLHITKTEKLHEYKNENELIIKFMCTYKFSYQNQLMLDSLLRDEISLQIHHLRVLLMP